MNAPRQDNDVLLILDISYVTYYICLAAVRRWKKQYYETALETIELPEPGSMPYDELPDLVNDTVYFKKVLADVAAEKLSVLSTLLLNITGHFYSSANTGVNRVDTVIARDAHGSTSFRRRIYPEYKMQRGAERASQNDFNHWKIFDHMYSTIYPQLLPRDCTYTIMHPEAEGDDVIASIIQSDFVRKRYRWVILISSDHDFCQLHRPENHLRQFSMDGEEVTCQYKYKRNNRNVVAPISADMAMMLKIITGDKSDNIPGIKQRLGICTAYKLLSEGDGKKNLQDLLDKDPAVKVAFNRNRKLIAFSEIPAKLQQEIVVDLRKKMGEPDA
jgi:5'-3' exonuclease